MKSLDTPIQRYQHTPADRTHNARHNDLACGIARWKATGYGIDPNQPALRHYPNTNNTCHCHWCAGTTITTTEPVSWP
jgi:hypothetical protein